MHKKSMNIIEIYEQIPNKREPKLALFIVWFTG